MVDLKTNYVISHGFAESGRLYLQHYLWKAQLGWEIHPEIKLPQDGDLKIADHGSGNGAWVLAVASELTESQSSRAVLYGYDISAVHYPAHDNVPGNVKFELLDAFTPSLPEELVGQFDVVHIRVFTAVVKGGNPGPLIENAYKMLKPGGYLQWDEFDNNTLRGVAPNDSISSTHTQKMVDVGKQSAQRAMNLDYSWLPKLGSLLQQQGFEVVVDERFEPRKDLRKPMTDSLLMVHDHVRRLALRNGKMPGTEEDFEELWASTGTEINQGVSVLADMLVLVGRKPL